jgi:FAD/FMN-containing dehydrogenase
MPATPAALEALRADLVALLGDRGVSADQRTRERASVDEATMSPILSAQLPLGLADLVAYPASADEIAATLQAAMRHGVPVTTRGKGTGNYGQGIPLDGGLVLDTSRARAVVEVGDGWITAEAGTTMVALEQAAAAQGQQLWMYPSTAQSTIGGFLSGGSGGTGSISHGSNWEGFVTALDIALPGEPDLVHVEGDAAQPFVHTYGTGGVIARATVRLEPLQDWRAVYASFPTFEQALTAVRTLRGLVPAPRLVSADRAEVAATLPKDDAIATGRASLRGIIDDVTLDEARALIESAGGVVEDVREGLQQTTKVSMLSYNHPIWWLKRSTPDTEYFHVEVGGDALIDRIAEVEAVYPGGMLHIEAAHVGPIGMLTAPYTGAEDVYAGYPALRDLGVRVHSPHQYYVDHGVEELVALKHRTDPDGLLNPGHVIDPSLVLSGGSTASAQPVVPGFGK